MPRFVIECLRCAVVVQNVQLLEHVTCSCSSVLMTSVMILEMFSVILSRCN